jgi:undecaprenyl-diphosphatase
VVVVAAHGGLSLVQAFVLAVLQGFTELFPFSSLGFQVIVPRLLHWGLDQSSPQFLAFVVTLHLGTAFGLLVYFWRDWVRLLVALWRSLVQGFDRVRTDPDQKTIWLLIAGTVPAGLVGLAFRHPLGHLFAAPRLAAAMLLVNAGIMWFGERLIRHRDEGIPKMRFLQSAGIGVAQILALIPGLSRSGVTMVGGLAVGLGYETAARFSFLLATPIIGAAALLEVHKLKAGGHGLLVPAAVGFVAAAVVAYLSARYLMRYFRTRRLAPLAAISAAAGLVFTILLALGA